MSSSRQGMSMLRFVLLQIEQDGRLGSTRTVWFREFSFDHLILPRAVGKYATASTAHMSATGVLGFTRLLKYRRSR